MTNRMLLIILPPAQAEFDLDKLSLCMSAVYEIYPAWRQTDKKERQRALSSLWSAPPHPDLQR